MDVGIKPVSRGAVGTKVNSTWLVLHNVFQRADRWTAVSTAILDPVLNTRIALDEREAALLEHPRIRRLKRVKQNGFAYLRFPRSTHTRMEHSLGVLYWATLMHRTLLGSDGGLRALRLAALVHDVGHGPFSHAMEILLRRNPDWRPRVRVFRVEDDALVETGERGARGHEDLTLEFIGSDLAAVEPHLAIEVHRIIAGDAGILSTILSSDVDADRMDYLIRDAYYSGIPFGRALGALFRSVVEGSMSVGTKAGREWIVIGPEAIQGIEMILAARFAAYRTIYHDPLSRTAESLFVSALESALEESDRPDVLVGALFRRGTDEEFHRGGSDDPEIDLVVSCPAVRRVMDRLPDLRPWPERRLITLRRAAIYHLIKVFENGRARELEEGLSMVLNRTASINVSIPNTLAPDLLVEETSIHPDFSPAFLYDYSPLVKALEDAMYSSATIISSPDLTTAVVGRALDGLLASIAGKDRDTFRDVVSAAILRYIERAADQRGDTFLLRSMRRRSASVFEVSGRVLSALGREADLIPPDSPYYGKDVYAVSRLLVFLRALVEIPDDTPVDGAYVPSYRCMAGPGIREVLRAVSLTPPTRRAIDVAVSALIEEKKGRVS